MELCNHDESVTLPRKSTLRGSSHLSINYAETAIPSSEKLTSITFGQEISALHLARILHMTLEPLSLKNTTSGAVFLEANPSIHLAKFTLEDAHRSVIFDFGSGTGRYNFLCHAIVTSNLLKLHASNVPEIQFVGVEAVKNYKPFCENRSNDYYDLFLKHLPSFGESVPNPSLDPSTIKTISFEAADATTFEFKKGLKYYGYSYNARFPRNDKVKIFTNIAQSPSPVLFACNDAPQSAFFNDVPKGTLVCLLQYSITSFTFYLWLHTPLEMVPSIQIIFPINLFKIDDKIFCQYIFFNLIFCSSLF